MIQKLFIAVTFDEQSLGASVMPTLIILMVSVAKPTVSQI
jgi:hypothetical protein